MCVALTYLVSSVDDLGPLACCSWTPGSEVPQAGCPRVCPCDSPRAAARGRRGSSLTFLARRLPGRARRAWPRASCPRASQPRARWGRRQRQLGARAAGTARAGSGRVSRPFSESPAWVRLQPVGVVGREQIQHFCSGRAVLTCQSPSVCSHYYRCMHIFRRERCR